MPSTPPPLLYTDTDRSSDMLYFGQVNVGDPFLAFSANGRRITAVSALEFGRVKRTSGFDVVLPLERFVKKAKKTWPKRKVGAAEVIFLATRKFGQKRFTVPEDFPAGLYRDLRRLGLVLDVSKGPLFPEREAKSRAEAEAIREGNRCSAAGIAAAKRVLQSSRIRRGLLHYRGEVLTSERLRMEIDIACLRAGSLAANTIAAGGRQACDPHERGYGPLRANDLIIVDVFPRVSATGYFGDMTRTFLRGRASDAQRNLVAAVRAAQLAALQKIRTGVDGRDVHGEVLKVFKKLGYRTKTTAKGSVGFFHGTGHGVGLAIHEPPRMNAVFEHALERGSVVTVEPGLYYPGVGGCRIEDVVQVTDKVPRMLSAFPYDWELR